MKQYLLFVFLLFELINFSQTTPIENYSVEEGLPSPEVYDIIQDDYGNLWFATDHGLSKYNGYEFENFGLKDGLTNNTIFQFFKRENGDIWCNTFDHSIFYISGNEPKFIPFKHNSSLTDTLTDILVEHNIYVDEDESVYLGFSNHLGYLQINTIGELIYHHWENISKDSCRIVLKSIENNKIFSYVSSNLAKNDEVNSYSIPFNNVNINGTCHFSEHQTSVFSYRKKVIIIRQNQGDLIINFDTPPVSLNKYDSTHFWISFRFGGVKIFDFNGLETNHLLPNKCVTDVFIDHQGATWMSTLSSGVFKFRNMGVKIIKSKIGEEWIESLTHDSEGHLYTGGYLGNISKVENDSLTSVFSSDYKAPAYVGQLKNNLLFNSTDGLYKNNSDKNTLIFNKRTSKWSVGSNNRLLLTWYTKIYYLKNDSIIKSIKNDKRIGAICSFRNEFYLGTKYGLYTIKNMELIPYRHSKMFLTHRIDALASHNDLLLLGTRGHGLGIIRDNDLTIIDKSDGLTSNCISGIYIENENSFWLSTNAGINHIELSKTGYDIFTFTFNDGLPSNQVTDIKVFNDTVWVATRKGLCFFNKKLLKEKSLKSSFHYLSFVGIKINDNKIEFTKELDLPYYKNRIEFNFQEISFKSNTPIIYRYKMIGLEDTWTYSKVRTAIYSYLPPGDYQFIVEVEGQNGWMNQKIQLVIHSPYWNTLSFKLGLLVLLSILIYLFFKYKVLSYNKDIIRELLRQLLQLFFQFVCHL